MKNLHFSQLIFAQAQRYGNKPVMYHRPKITDSWLVITWDEMARQVSCIAKALLELGVSEGERVGQFSQNKAENLIVDYALFANRAVVVPMYATSTPSQVEYIVDDSEIQILFVGDQNQLNIAKEVMNDSKSLKRIVVFDPSVVFAPSEKIIYFHELLELGLKSTRHFEVEQRQTEATETDLACILYTSGTTGNPKGVMLPHSCFNEAMRIHTIRITEATDADTSIAFLPLSHVFERTWSYFMLFKGATIYINQFPVEIQQTIKDVRPTLMCSVPRFWEKVYAGVQENLASFSPFKLGLVTWATAVGKNHNIDYLRIGKKPDLILRIKYALADKLIFSKVKKTIGIENAKLLPTAGAKLSDDLTLFFQSIGVPIDYGYGLTESTATVACYKMNDFVIGTVGTIMPNVQVKIGEDNEILLKGKTIFSGYYRNEEANKAAFTEDGWFRTGDAGKLTENRLILTERIKDLFKTSNGKYIAPQAIETRLGLDKYIEQIAVIGDERNYVTAIVAPSIPAIEAYAKEKGIAYVDVEELLQMEQINAFLLNRIAQLQQGMAPYEIVKRIKLVRKGFSMEAGELTNTLKLRRAVIMQKYKHLIDEMYS